jgi:thiol-disulfide isomerase/thioredoxin
MRMLAVTIVVVAGYAAYGPYVKSLLHAESMRLGDFSIDDEVPDFTLTDLEGVTLRLDEAVAEHDLVLINFWASWCGPCRMEKPMLERIQEKYGGEGLLILAINVGEREDLVREFVEDTGLTLRVLIDEEGAVADQLGVRGLPTTILVDRNRRLKHTIVGLNPSMEWIVEWTLESS